MREIMGKRLTLAITLVLFVFVVMMSTFLLVALFVTLLQHLGILSLSWQTIHNGRNTNYIYPLFVLFGFCIFLGTALTAFLSKKALNPIKKVIAATNRVAEGDFSVQISLKGIGELEELSQSFNKMTRELSSIETLRGDFVNNFSHEFKTPIVSMRGFAKLLKDTDLTAAEREEYLNIIISESERLAALSTNVLNLSKIENTGIITQKEPFRLDEQIRRAIVLLEPKWTMKQNLLSVKLEDIIYFGNEDLTQQIWLNLLDNAIKFSNRNGKIDVSLEYWNGGIRFVVSDEGQGMNEETKIHLFEKFYQGDRTHTKAGNGLGLALVKQIVDKYDGTVAVESHLGAGSKFIVWLPRNQ